MEGAADLHSQITREFSFIQELIWSPPHKNPFPFSSEKILSSLKTLDAWRRSSLTGRKSAGSLIMTLDADTRTLIDIRRRFCKLLSSIEPQLSDAHTIVKLEKEVDGIIVRHMEKAWKDLKINLMKNEDQQATNIDHEALTDTVKQFLHDHSPKTEVGQEGGSSAVTSAPPSDRGHPMHIFTATGGLSKAQENRKSTLHIVQSEIVSESYLSGTSDEESHRSITELEEFQDETDTEARTHVELSSSENDEYLSANSDEEINPPTAVIKGAKELHPFKYRAISPVFLHSQCVEKKTDQSLLNSNSEGHNELERSMLLAVRSTTTHEKVTEEKVPLQAKEELHVGDEQSGKNNPGRTDVLNRNITSTTNPGLTTLREPELSKIVTQARSEHSTVTVEDNEESDHAEQGASISLNRIAVDHDDEFQSGKDEAYQSGVSVAIHHKPLIQDHKKFIQSELQRGMSSFVTEPVTDESESSQDESEPDHDEKASEALSPVATAKTERDSTNSQSQLSKSVNLPMEVEMTMRAKLCASESEEPYWHVIFALKNGSCHKIGVQKLSYWSLNSVDDITTVKWPPGKLILREQPSFLGYSIKVPCRASYDSPRMAFSWHYSKITKWIPTGDSRSKTQSASIRKRLGSLLSSGDTNKKMKWDAKASNGGNPKLPKLVDN